MKPGRQLIIFPLLVFAGVTGGHVAGYALVAPDHHDRHELLARTGHHYLPSALEAGVFAAVLGLSLAFLLGVTRGLRGARGGGARWIIVLPAAQTIAFAGLEVTERLVASGSLHDLGWVLAAGLPVQALIGLAAGLLVSSLDRAGVRLGQRIRLARGSRRRATVPALRPGASVAPPAWRPGPPIPARGPPQLLVLPA